MGTEYHGGFGNTKGSDNSKPVAASPTFAGDKELKAAAKYLKPIPGYTDIVIHGMPDSKSASIYHNGKWVNIDQRRLAAMYKKSGDYSKNPIRLVSCYSGVENGTFAQNLSNKLGVKVMAPSDKVWILANGNTSIGKEAYKNTGKWIIYYPQKGKK